MPVNQWNWYRAVGTGNDHKNWLGDNPQVKVYLSSIFFIHDIVD